MPDTNTSTHTHANSALYLVCQLTLNILGIESMLNPPFSVQGQDVESQYLCFT